ncbi:hypothetical protein ABB26_03180 [Stenotrophomonas humi]|uniref:HTH lysR-type domain-containing protein n=1 Tax=Stenotrophomonas humi TaxID=405444 RepID=A0A0R0CLC0_9GAMM|nr:LysR family transcriptional regulator [Stenotrophomonas humi]KRG65672.1 hypothetical protein ABB26_03180 [Stenotrophomonas humi]
MTTPQWDDQRILLAVLREGSLLGAARIMGVSQPTIRRRIEALEDALGTVLFTRTAATVVPTQSVLDLLPHLEAMEQAAAAFQRGASANVNELGGTVRIAASELWGGELLPPLLLSLRTRHPNLQLELAVSNDVESLIDHHADIAIRTVKPAHDALVARRLGSSTVGLYATQEFLEHHGTPSNLEQLADWPLITPDRSTRDWAVLAQLGYPLYQIRSALRVDNHLAQLAAIRAGLGIGPCHSVMARRQRLVRVLKKDFDFRTDVWIAMPESLRGVARVSTVFRYLGDTIAELLSTPSKM